jgi:hypothetical protein
MRSFPFCESGIFYGRLNLPQTNMQLLQLLLADFRWSLRQQALGTLSLRERNHVNTNHINTNHINANHINANHINANHINANDGCRTDRSGRIAVYAGIR